MKAAWFAIIVMAAVGCGRNPVPDPQTPSSTAAVGPAMEQATSKSSVGTVIDGLTGKTAVEAGKRTRKKLEDIGRQEQHDLNEAMQP